MNDDIKRILSESPAEETAAGRSPRIHGNPHPLGCPLPSDTSTRDEARVWDSPRSDADRVYTLDGPHLAAQSTPPTGIRMNLSQAGDVASKVGYQLLVIDVHKSYRTGAVAIPVLRGVNLAVRRGEFLAIVGSSGSGKSTLLHLLGTLDAPGKGEIYFEDRRIDNISGHQRDALRNRQFGMIFQFYHLLPELSTLENVLAPLMIGHSALSYFCRRRKHRAAAIELLETVGLGHRLRHKPRELSGGEMQRAAIARALVTGPQLLLADEPTGNLDQKTGREIIEILRSLNDRENLTIVMVTHDHAIAERADRVIRLVDGQVENA